jgi:hypothetical protein
MCRITIPGLPFTWHVLVVTSTLSSYFFRREQTKMLRTMDSDTPLHLSSMEGHLEVIKLLLAEGADPHIQNKDSHTPLDIAHSEGHNDIVAVLSVAS